MRQKSWEGKLRNIVNEKIKENQANKWIKTKIKRRFRGIDTRINKYKQKRYVRYLEKGQRKRRIVPRGRQVKKKVREKS